MHLEVHHQGRCRAAAQHHTRRRNLSRAAAWQVHSAHSCAGCPSTNKQTRAQRRRYLAASSCLGLVHCCLVFTAGLPVQTEQCSSVANTTNLPGRSAVSSSTWETQPAESNHASCASDWMSLYQFQVLQLCCSHMRLQTWLLCAGLAPALARQCSVSCAALLRPLACNDQQVGLNLASCCVQSPGSPVGSPGAESPQGRERPPAWSQ